MKWFRKKKLVEDKKPVEDKKQETGYKDDDLEWKIEHALGIDDKFLKLRLMKVLSDTIWMLFESSYRENCFEYNDKSRYYRRLSSKIFEDLKLIQLEVLITKK